MKIVLSLVVLCISFTLSSFFVAHAQVRVIGGITTEYLTGEGYKVEFYGDLVVGPDGLLSSAMLQGKGQYYLADEKILVTSEKITEISSESLTVQINGKSKVFRLNKTTKICNGDKSVRLVDIKKDDMVTITSRVDQQTALSVRKGPMLFGGPMSGRYELKKYKCE